MPMAATIVSLLVALQLANVASGALHTTRDGHTIRSAYTTGASARQEHVAAEPHYHGPVDLSWTKKGACPDQVAALLRKMSTQEKYLQLNDGAPSVPRLGIPAMSWWSEGIHGLMSDQAQGGTLFPSPLTLGASWDPTLAKRMAHAVVLEALAYETQARKSKDAPYRSIHLNLFAPNINLLRDPRWGRGCETYGEDPAHMARMATGYVTGVQGEDPSELRVGATCKHFAAHSLEAADGVTRHNYDALVDDRDLAESYLPAFEACVDAGARSVMCSYNRLNGVPACANAFLLNETLRDTWGFTGFVTSDCWAISDVTNAHHFVQRNDVAAAVAVTTAAGCDMACGGEAAHLGEALARGLLSEAEVDVAVERVLLARCQRNALTAHLAGQQQQEAMEVESEERRQGEEPNKGDVSLEVIGSPEHLELAREIQRKSTVLLVNRPVPASPESPTGQATSTATPSKSRLLQRRRERAQARRQQRASEGAAEEEENGDVPLLPLDLGDVKKVLVFGALSDAKEHLLGTYYNKPSGPVVSVLEALRTYFASKAPGVQLLHENVFDNLLPGSADWIMGSTDDAADVDLVVVVVGSSSVGQQSQGVMVEPVFETEGLDRDSLRLQGKQQDLVLAAARSGTPVVVVLVHGGPLDVSPLLAAPAVGAIISMGYPGQLGNEVLAPLLFGEFSPSGRTSVTWQFNNYTELSAMSDMSMRTWPGRTYKYLQVPVVFEMGHGLSYIQWQYADESVRPCDAAELLAAAASPAAAARSSLTGAVSRAHGCLMVGFSLTNVGPLDGDEVVIMFAERKEADSDPDAPPRKQLVAFRRVSVTVGQSVRITFQLTAAHLAHADLTGAPTLDTRQPVWLRIGRSPTLLPLDLSAFRLDPPVPRSKLLDGQARHASSMPVLADLQVEPMAKA